MSKFEVTRVRILEGAPTYEESFEGTRKACRAYKKILDEGLSEIYERIFIKEDNSIYICDENELLIVTINERT